MWDLSTFSAIQLDHCSIFHTVLFISVFIIDFPIATSFTTNSFNELAFRQILDVFLNRCLPYFCDID